jgi:tetratricopeptide (TPR) repeat protein
MSDRQPSPRSRAIDEIFRKTMLAQPNSREYVVALIEAADEIASIDGVLFERTAREACIVAESIQEWSLFARALAKRAWALFRSGSLGEALVCAEHAAHIARQRGEGKSLNGALYAIASIRGRIGDTDGAERIWLGLIASAQMLEDKILEARSRNMYGVALTQVSRHGQAFEQYVSACQILTELGDKANALYANNAASAALSAGRAVVASEWLEQALLSCPPDAGLWISLIQHTRGRLAVALNRRDIAREAFAESLEILPGERDDVSHSANLYLDIGLLHIGDGDAKKALAPLDHALALAQDSGDAALVARVHDALHAAYEKIGDFTTALQHCRDGTTALKRHAEAKSAEHVAVLKAAESLVHERAGWSAIRYDA